MSLGVPGQVVKVEGMYALVDFWGTVRRVRLDGLPCTVAAGDYVINHAGFAVRRIAPDQVIDTLAMYEVVLCELGEDPLTSECALEAELVTV